MNRLAKIKALSSDEILKEVTSIIVRYLPSSKIFLFGSRVSGKAQENSDFDIAIDAGIKIPLEIISKIKDEIDKLSTLKTIDIVDIKRVNNKLKKIIFERGVVINERS